MEQTAAGPRLDRRQRGHVDAAPFGFRTRLVDAFLQLHFAAFVQDLHARALHLQVSPAVLVDNDEVHRILRRLAEIFDGGVPPDGLGTRQFPEPDLGAPCGIGAEHIFVVVDRLDPAVGELDHAVAVQVHEVRFMRHQHDQMLLRDASQHVHDLEGIGLVKVAGRLIREDDRRVFHDRAGDGHALLLAAGKGIRPPQAELAHAHGRKRRCDPLTDRFFVFHPDKAQGVGNVLLHAFLRVQVVILENIADLAVSEGIGITPDILPVHRQAPAGKAVQPADDVQQRGLAAAAAAEDGNHAPVGQFQRDLIQDVNGIGLSLVVIFVNFFEADHTSSPPRKVSRTLRPKSFFTCL